MDATDLSVSGTSFSPITQNIWKFLFFNIFRFCHKGKGRDKRPTSTPILHFPLRSLWKAMFGPPYPYLKERGFGGPHLNRVRLLLDPRYFFRFWLKSRRNFKVNHPLL